MAYIYDPDNKFGYKDTLPPESDEKVIRGTDFDAEFKRIEAGVGDSFDESNAGLQQEIEDRIIGDQNLQDQINGLDNSQIVGDIDAEIQARIEGDQALQDQIDALDPDGDRKVDWGEIDDKPTEFPPSAHQQGWDTITGKPSEYPPESHEHQISDVDGLQDALDNAGGTPSWNDLTDKPAEFPPEDHTHVVADITDFDPSDYQPKGDYLTDFVEEDPTVPDHVKGITQDDIDGWNAGGGGSGNGNPVVISDDPPASPEEGDLWYSSKTDDEGLYCWDGTVWFEAGGANGADGADGKQIWSETTPDGDIFYDKGDVSVSGDVAAGNAKIGTLTVTNGTGVGLTNVSAGTSLFIANNGSSMGPNTDGTVDAGALTRRYKDGFFNGTVSTNTIDTNRSSNGFFFRAKYGDTGQLSSFNHSGGNSLEISPLGSQLKVNGTISDSSGPLMSTRSLISTLTTLRNATKDETTLEGLRDSIGNAIGGLIERFEAEVADTMEISE